MRDLYQILGVGRDADTDAIKRAYRQRAHRDHPDKNPGDKSAEERFKEASVAYKVLSDPAKRQRYDRMGDAGLHAQPGGGGEAAAGTNVGDMFSELFGDFFGSRRQGPPPRGRDRVQSMEVDFRTALLGGQVPVEAMREQACERCGGSGSRSGKPAIACAKCGGSGEARVQQGMFAFSRRCVACQGQGRVTADPCGECVGSGRLRRLAKMMVRVPAGASHGSVLRLAGGGEPGQAGAAAGDLRLKLSIRAHPLLSRNDPHLSCEAWVSPAQAALGAQVEVPTLGAPLRMKIPAGSQPGQIFRLRGQGTPARPGAAASDLMVTLQVECPASTSAAALEAWRQLAGVDDAGAYPRRASWQQKMEAQKAPA